MFLGFSWICHARISNDKAERNKETCFLGNREEWSGMILTFNFLFLNIFLKIDTMKNAWDLDSFNNIEASAISELISCLKDCKGDLSG